MQSVSYQPSADLDSNTATGGVSGEETEIQMRQLRFKMKIGEVQNCETQRPAIRGGRRPMGNSKSQKFDGCPMNSHFIGLGLLRTVFGIVVACWEGPPPEFCCVAGDNTATNQK